LELKDNNCSEMFLFYVLWLIQPCQLNSCLKLQVTKESFRDDGFFKTGDTVTIVDGYLKILGRESMLALESLCSILSVACLFIVVVLLHSQEVSVWFYISSQTCFATMCSYHAL
jgi:acyl-CoA synthetase (AMP-forming)/AMP-acid ligase II